MTGPPAAPAGPLGWLRSAWEGRQPLAVSYWLVGVAGNMAWLALLVLLYLLGAPLAALWLVYFASLAWFVLVFAAVNCAARAHRGPPVWALPARAGVRVGVVRMWGEALLLSCWQAAAARPISLQRLAAAADACWRLWPSQACHTLYRYGALRGGLGAILRLPA